MIALLAWGAFAFNVIVTDGFSVPIETVEGIEYTYTMNN